MNSAWFRASHLAAATLLIGGGLLAALPHHAPSIVRLVFVSMAAAMALHALTSSTPPRWWRSPFVRGRRGPARAADEVDFLRALMAGPRQRLPGAVPLPPEIISALRPLLRAAVDGHGGGSLASLAPQSRAVLDAAEHRQPPWYRLLPPDPEGTARAVQVVLDDVEGMTTSRTAVEPYTATTPGTS